MTAQESQCIETFWHQLEAETNDLNRTQCQDDGFISLLPLLLTLREKLSSGNDLPNTLKKLDAVIKTFEVHKRLYKHYTAELKLAKEQNYRDLRLYLIFADLLTIAYRHNQNLIYLNALLKVNDTLLSQDSLCKKAPTEPLYLLLKQVISFEVMEVKKLLAKNNINWV